jgi:hypothetical protein
MTDEPEGIYQPESEPARQPDQPADNQPKYVTEDGLRAELDKLWKGIQSMTAKHEKRVSKQLEEWEKRVSESGITVSNDMRQAAEQRIALSMLEEDNKAAKPVEPQKSRVSPDVVEQVNTKMRELSGELGVTLTEDDPEYWEVNYTNPNPEKFLQQYERKLKAKAERVSQVQLAQPGNPAARVPAPTGFASGGIDSLNSELAALQAKAHPSPAEEKRRKEIVAELLKHVPKR